MDKVENILKELLAAAGIPYSNIERSSVAGQEIFAIRTDDARTLIGAHGDTVYALDFLVKKIFENGLPEPAEGETAERTTMFLVDVNDYRTKQIKDLQAKALMMAKPPRRHQVFGGLISAFLKRYQSGMQSSPMTVSLCCPAGQSGVRNGSLPPGAKPVSGMGALCPEGAPCCTGLILPNAFSFNIS